MWPLLIFEASRPSYVDFISSHHSNDVNLFPSRQTLVYKISLTTFINNLFSPVKRKLEISFSSLKLLCQHYQQTANLIMVSNIPNKLLASSGPDVMARV